MGARVQELLHGAPFGRQEDLLVGIRWEEWLEVVVSPGYRDPHANEAALQISYSPLKRGVDPKTGIVHTINSNGFAVPFPKPKRAGEPDPEERWPEISIGMRSGSLWLSAI